MSAAISFGGVFFHAKDPKALTQWYEHHLGLKKEGGAHGFAVPTVHPQIVFSLFKADSDYFPTAQHAMLNLQVDDLDALLDSLTAAGVEVDPKRDAYDFGKFGWITDPEGNRVELWQPLGN